MIEHRPYLEPSNLEIKAANYIQEQINQILRNKSDSQLLSHFSTDIVVLSSERQRSEVDEILLYPLRSFTEESLKTKFDSYRSEVNLFVSLSEFWNTEITLSLFKTNGLSGLTSLYYPVCLMIYDISDMNSYRDAVEWAYELDRLGKRIILVGINSYPDRKRKVPYNRAKKLSKKIKCSHVEVSAKTGENIRELYTEIVRQLLNPLGNERNSLFYNNIGVLFKVQLTLDSNYYKQLKPLYDEISDSILVYFKPYMWNRFGWLILDRELFVQGRSEMVENCEEGMFFATMFLLPSDIFKLIFKCLV